MANISSFQGYRHLLKRHGGRFLREDNTAASVWLKLRRQSDFDGERYRGHFVLLNVKLRNLKLIVNTLLANQHSNVCFSSYRNKIVSCANSYKHHSSNCLKTNNDVRCFRHLIIVHSENYGKLNSFSKLGEGHSNHCLRYILLNNGKDWASSSAVKPPFVSWPPILHYPLSEALT